MSTGKLGLSPFQMLFTLLIWVAYPTVYIGALFIHVYTAIIAFSLVGGVWGFVAFSLSFALPVISEIGALIYTWMTSGMFVNNYSFWVFSWLSIVLVLAALLFVVNIVVKKVD